MVFLNLRGHHVIGPLWVPISETIFICVSLYRLLKSRENGLAWSKAADNMDVGIFEAGPSVLWNAIL